MAMINKVDHIGIAVFGIEQVVEKFCRTYRKTASEITIIEERKMKVAVVPFKGCAIEFFEDMNDESLLRKKVFSEGAFIHHFALKSSDIEGDMGDLENFGCLRNGSEANIGLRGKQILFYMDKTLSFPIELTE